MDMVRSRGRPDHRGHPDVWRNWVRAHREQGVRRLYRARRDVSRDIQLNTRRALTLIRWRTVAASRELARDAFGTLQGRLMLLTLVVASPGLAQLLRVGGPLSQTALEDHSRIGVLVVAHVALTVCFLVMVPVMLLKSLVLEQSTDPLRAHPSFLPDAAMLRVAGAILTTSTFLLIFLYLFYGPILVDDAGARWVRLLGHFGVAQVQFVVVGVLAAAGTRRLLRGPQLVARAERLQRLSVAPFLLSFPLFLLLPGALYQHRPAWLTAAGSLAPDLLFLLQSPIAISEAIRTTSLGLAALWIAALLSAACASGLALGRWRGRAVRDLAHATGGKALANRKQKFAFWCTGPTLLRQAQLFWTKDLISADRFAWRHLRLHACLLSLALIALFTMAQLPSTALLVRVAEVGPSQVLIGLVAYLAMARTLGSLGREGAQLRVLRPVVSMRRLFAVKTLVNTGCVLLQAPFYALAIGSVSQWMGLEVPSLRRLVLEGATAGLTFAALGSALGFLLPDFHRRSLLCPGASRISQLLFAALSGSAIAIHAVGLYLIRTGAIDGWGLARIGGVTTGFLAALIVLASGWGIRRTQRMEV